MFRWWWLLVPIPVGLSRTENVFEVRVNVVLQYVLRCLDYISSVVRSSLVKDEGEINPKPTEAEPETDAAHTD